METFSSSPLFVVRYQIFFFMGSGTIMFQDGSSWWFCGYGFRYSGPVVSFGSCFYAHMHLQRHARGIFSHVHTHSHLHLHSRYTFLHTHLCAHLYLHSLILVPVLTLSHLYLHLQLHLGLYTLIFAFTSEASCTLKLAFALSPRLNIIKQYKHILRYQGEGVPESTGTVGVVSCLNFFLYL